MRSTCSLRVTGIVLLAGALPAQYPAAPLAAQVARAYDHVHFSVPDPQVAQDWYMAHLGGTAGESPDRVVFGGMPWTGEGPIPVQLLWARSPEGAPAVSGSPIVGIGLSFPDLEGRVAALQRAGARVVATVGATGGPWPSAVVEDPWGVRIELVDDPARRGFHHVKLRAPDVSPTLEWYRERFGGDRVRVGNLDGLDYQGTYLFVIEGPEEPFTAGYGVNHVAWAAYAMDPLADRLRSLGARFTTEPRETLNAYGHRVAFLEGPGGVRIEVVEHTQCPFTPPSRE